MTWRTAWLLLAIVALALNLRPPFTAPGALLPDIAQDLGMSPTLTGLLPTLPVLCLSIFAVATPSLRRLWGDEGVAVACLAVIAAGSVLRVGPGVVSLFAGTVVVGAAVGVANVLLPGLIKREFPARITLITSIYTVFLTLGSSIAAAGAVPVMHATGGSWRVPLLLLAVLGGASMLLWLPLLRSRHREGKAARSSGSLLRVPLAWQVTAFMGLQSTLAYVVFGWMPTIAQSRGLADTSAGLLLSLSTLMQAVGGLSLPLLAGRRLDQRPLAVGLYVVTVLGLLAFFLGPLPWIWGASIMLGFGMGGLFGLALCLIGLRAGDAATAARLSSMSQAGGYLLAAAGPLLVGILHEATGEWLLPMGLLLLVCIAGTAAGVGAGRPAEVGGAQRDEVAVPT
jgi:MFS transporter, CP family, cyanate transporter